MELKMRIDVLDREMKEMRNRQLIQEAYSDKSSSKKSSSPRQQTTAVEGGRSKTITTRSQKAAVLVNSESVGLSNEQKLETIVKGTLDKFSVEMASAFSNISSDIRQLVKVISKDRVYRYQQREMTSDAGKIKVSGSIKKSRKVESKKAVKELGERTPKLTKTTGRKFSTPGVFSDENIRAETRMRLETNDLVESPIRADDDRDNTRMIRKILVREREMREGNANKKDRNPIPSLRRKVPKTTAVAITCVGDRHSCGHS